MDLSGSCTDVRDQHISGDPPHPRYYESRQSQFPELFAEITKRWKKENVSVSVWLTALYLYTYVSTAAA